MHNLLTVMSTAFRIIFIMARMWWLLDRKCIVCLFLLWWAYIISLMGGSWQNWETQGVAINDQWHLVMQCPSLCQHELQWVVSVKVSSLLQEGFIIWWTQRGFSSTFLQWKRYFQQQLSIIKTRESNILTNRIYVRFYLPVRVKCFADMHQLKSCQQHSGFLFSPRHGAFQTPD